MWSDIPTNFSTEPVYDNPFPSFEHEFTPREWDCSDLFSVIQPFPKTLESHSGSDSPTQNQNQNQNQTQTQANSNSGSDEPVTKDDVSVVDERKRRRMISNRESARRSRVRKQKHLENIRNQLNRLRTENRELSNRLQFVMYHNHLVHNDNDRLRSEHSYLRQKLSEIRQKLVFRQLQQFSSPACPAIY